MIIKIVRWLERQRDDGIFDGVRVTCNTNGDIEFVSYGVATFDRFAEEHKNDSLLHIVRDLELMGFDVVRRAVLTD